MSEVDISALVGGVLQSLSQSPVGAWTGSEQEKQVERSYLQTLTPTYIRTVSDVFGYFKKHKAEPSQVRIIEFGPYLGAVSRSLAKLGFNVSVSEYPGMLTERLRSSYAGTGITLYAQDLARPLELLQDETFDCVIFCETLEHLNFNPVPVMSELNRVLRPGGLLYLAVPNVASLRNRLYLLCGKSIHNPVADFFEQLRPDSLMGVGLHWREYTREEAETLLLGTGFAVQESRYFDIAGPSTRSGLGWLLKRAALGLVPSVASSIVLMAVKSRRSDPTAVDVGKSTIDLAR